MNHEANSRADRVILVHGLASSSILFRPMARHLRNCGFETSLYGYFSIRGSIDRHADRFRRFVDSLTPHTDQKIHVVAHSMGSIVTRRALLKLESEANSPQIGRVVMLAPPNQGSHVATRLSPYLGGICPALNELADHSESYVRNLGTPTGFDIGIVAADGDLVVPDHSTRLGIEADFINFPGMHTALLFRKDVMQSVAEFLQVGKFSDAQVAERV